jgi:hypothetical protein
MTAPDYRALCAELVEQLQRAISEHGFCLEAEDALMYRARTALTQPKPEEPTDEELLSADDLKTAWNAQADAANSWDELGIDEIVWFAQQQALARWGRPAIEPEGPPAVMTSALLHPAYEPDDGSADGAQMVGMAWWRPVMGCDSLQLVVDNARNILRSRWGRPAVKPVPVSEGMPGPEDCAPWPDEPDCDPWCWAAKDIDGGWEWTQLSIGHFSSDLGRVYRKRGYTHWLPHHALPVPEVTP